VPVSHASFVSKVIVSKAVYGFLPASFVSKVFISRADARLFAYKRQA
jgi:hypothetical protein